MKISKTDLYNTVICATVKNEAYYLLEWIAYHRIIGVEHFLIYNNDSTDRTELILKNLEKANIVTYINWPSKPGQRPQFTAYEDAVKKLQGNCKWVAFIDADEYILLQDKKNIQDFLLDYENVAGIAINWKIFGSSGHLQKNDGLVIERFKKCASSVFGANGFVKTIARPELIKYAGIHICTFAESSVYIHPDRTPYRKEMVGKDDYIDYKTIQINHYHTKSKAEWDLKRARGRATRELDSSDKLRPEHIFYHHDRNEEEDLTILNFLPQTKQEIKYLSELAQLDSIQDSLQAQVDRIEIFKISILYQYTQERLIEASIDSPSVSMEVDPSTLKIAGFAIGHKSKVVTVQIICDGRIVGETPVLQTYPQFTQPDDSEGLDFRNGVFSASVSIIGMPTQAEILVQAVLENQKCVPIGLIQYGKISNLLLSGKNEMNIDLIVTQNQYQIKKTPLLSKSAIQFLREFFSSQSDPKVLEFGSGSSTVWLSRFTASLISIEHHPDWYDKVKSTISEDPTCQSVDLRLQPLPYYSVCDEFPDEYFDLIIVDGRDRIKCLEAAIRILKPGGVLMLDDAQRERYDKADNLLRDWEFTRSISPTRQTHWWIKPLHLISPQWQNLLQNNPVRLYTGNLTERHQQDGWIGISKVKSDESHIPHDWRKLLPIPDESVDAFLCEEFLKFIPPHQLLSVVFPELYRTLKPGGYIRMALPDYRCDVYLNRSLKDEKGYPYCDPEGGGKWDAEQQKVTEGGLAWFPTYETLKALIDLSPLRYCRADWLHYYDPNGEPVMNEIDYSKGFIKRTPDNDNRVKNPRRPMSIVVDLYKD